MRCDHNFTVPPLSLLTLPLFSLHPEEAGSRAITRWGRIQRYGPALDVYDEDTLIGIFLAIGLTRSTPPPDFSIGYIVSPVEVNRRIGRPDGRHDIITCGASIHRLALVSFTVKTNGLELSGSIFGGAIWSLPHTLSDRLAIDFTGVGIGLFEAYSHLDLEVREQLTPIGKSLHRLLTGLLPYPGASVLCPVEDLAAAIGYYGRLPALVEEVAHESQILMDFGWLAEARVPSSAMGSFMFLRG